MSRTKRYKKLYEKIYKSGDTYNREEKKKRNKMQGDASKLTKQALSMTAFDLLEFDVSDDLDKALEKQQPKKLSDKQVQRARAAEKQAATGVESQLPKNDPRSGAKIGSRAKQGARRFRRYIIRNMDAKAIESLKDGDPIKEVLVRRERALNRMALKNFRRNATRVGITGGLVAAGYGLAKRRKKND